MRLIVAVVETKEINKNSFSLSLCSWISKHAAVVAHQVIARSHDHFCTFLQTAQAGPSPVAFPRHFQHAPAKSPISHIHSILHMFLLPSDASEDSTLAPKHAYCSDSVFPSFASTLEGACMEEKRSICWDRHMSGGWASGGEDSSLWMLSHKL